MSNNSYDNPLTTSAHVLAPTQDLPSYHSRGANDAVHVPSSGLGSQVRPFQRRRHVCSPQPDGDQYDFFQEDIPYQDFAQASHFVRVRFRRPTIRVVCSEFFSQSSFRHPIPLVPENVNYTSGICPPRREQFPPNVAAASSHLDRHGGRQQAMPFGQTGSMNVSHIH